MTIEGARPVGRSADCGHRPVRAPFVLPSVPFGRPVRPEFVLSRRMVHQRPDRRASSDRPGAVSAARYGRRVSPPAPGLTSQAWQAKTTNCARSLAPSLVIARAAGGLVMVGDSSASPRDRLACRQPSGRAAYRRGRDPRGPATAMAAGPLVRSGARASHAPHLPVPDHVVLADVQDHANDHESSDAHQLQPLHISPRLVGPADSPGTPVSCPWHLARRCRSRAGSSIIARYKWQRLACWRPCLSMFLMSWLTRSSRLT
jgi:hypothetical protein